MKVKLMQKYYDRNNIFARILRGELDCDKIYEDDHAIAFDDINPAAPVHVLVIPKSPFLHFSHFASNAKPEEIAQFFMSAQKVIKKLNLEESGCRIIMNQGADGVQTIPHLHLHILGGKRLGPLLLGEEYHR